VIDELQVHERMNWDLLEHKKESKVFEGSLSKGGAKKREATKDGRGSGGVNADRNSSARARVGELPFRKKSKKDEERVISECGEKDPKKRGNGRLVK